MKGLLGVLTGAVDDDEGLTAVVVSCVSGALLGGLIGILYRLGIWLMGVSWCPEGVLLVVAGFGLMVFALRRLQ